MIILDPNKMTGKQVRRIVDKAVKERVKLGKKASLNEFYRVSGMSSMHMSRLSRNASRAGLLTIEKVAHGLRSWGYRVDVRKIVIRFDV